MTAFGVNVAASVFVVLLSLSGAEAAGLAQKLLLQRRSAPPLEQKRIADSVATGPRSWQGTTHFLSNDGQLCGQGTADVAEGALALKKAGFEGALYNLTFAHEGSCEALGYTYRVGDGADDCYDGLAVFYKDEHEANNFRQSQMDAVITFARHWDLGPARAQTISDCLCHPSSSRKQAVLMECPDVLNGMSGSWVHRDPANQAELMCDGGPLLEATLALAVLKSTLQLPMHQYDQIAPVRCDALGFPHMYSVIDHCFAGLHMWTRTLPMEIDAGIRGSTDVENSLRAGGMQAFEEENDLNDSVLNRIFGCHCSPHSELVHGERAGTCEGQMTSSPIRSWWSD